MLYLVLFLSYDELQAERVIFTYPTPVRLQIWQSFYRLNFRTVIGSQSMEIIALLIGEIIIRYFNSQCMRPQSTSVTDGRTDDIYDSNTALRNACTFYAR